MKKYLVFSVIILWIVSFDLSLQAQPPERLFYSSMRLSDGKKFRLTHNKWEEGAPLWVKGY